MTIPFGIHVVVKYDSVLEKITGKAMEEATVSGNLSFIDFLYFLFSSYPEIQKQYPPGKLGFVVNGQPPKETDSLHDGDEIRMVESS